MHSDTHNVLDTDDPQQLYVSELLDQAFLSLMDSATHPNYPLYAPRLSKGWMFGRKVVGYPWERIYGSR